MTSWKIFAVDTQFKQLRKRSLKKKFRLQRDSNPWPLRYRCSALPTELWSHNCWEQVNFSESIMPLRVIQHYSDWVCTAVMSKWRHERSSRLIRNLSNCEREAWKKNSGFSGIRTRDLCDTGAVQRSPVSQRSRVRIPLKPEFFFRLLFRNCLNCVSTAKIFHDVIYSYRGTNPVTIMLYYP